MELVAGFVIGLGTERLTGQGKGSPSRIAPPAPVAGAQPVGLLWAWTLHIRSTEAAASGTVIPTPGLGTSRAHGGCKVGKIPRFLSSEFITF